MLDKEKILKTAIKLVNKKKTVHVTVSEIAKKLKVTPPGVNNVIKMREIEKHIYEELTK